MRDDDSGDVGRSYRDDTADGHLMGYADELFGDYSVLSPGVQIVLEGRPVSNIGH